MNAFTISFWVNAQSLIDGSVSGQGSNNHAHRLLTLGPSGTQDVTTATGLGFVVRPLTANTTTPAGIPGSLDIYEKTGAGALGVSVTQDVGITSINTNSWVFVALTYDGTSSNANNSAVQQGLTGSNINGQFYVGTDATSATRFAVPFSSVLVSPEVAADKTNASRPSAGTFNFGANAVMILGNRTTNGRAFDGLIDDIRIYDTTLSPAEVEQVRLQAIPEPSSVMLVTLGSLGLIYVRLKRTR